MEGDLRGLREGADEDQHQGQVDQPALQAAGLPDRHDLGDAVGPGPLAQQDEAQQHDEAAQHRHQERLHRGAAVLPRHAALPHQQERRDRRQLPEHVERQQVVGEDEAQHRPGEGEQQRGVARALRILPEVADAVDEDQRADPGDEDDHRQREGVEPEAQHEPELGCPGDRGAHAGGQGLGGVRQRPDERRGRKHGRDHEPRPLAAGRHDRQQAREDEVGDDEPEHDTPFPRRSASRPGADDRPPVLPRRRPAHTGGVTRESG